MLNDGYGRKKYLEHLEQKGVVLIRKCLKAIAYKAGGRQVLLCCFESLSADKVAAGQWCHRRIFADWWQKKTGHTIAELYP